MFYSVKRDTDSYMHDTKERMSITFRLERAKLKGGLYRRARVM